MNETQRRSQVRSRGASALAEEQEERTLEVPVERIRDYWEPIVGVSRPFEVTAELAAWAEEQYPLYESGGLTEGDWKALFSKMKPRKATGPDGIRGFWWKHFQEAKEKLIL
ncbi:hypothetical protein Aduo_001453 [Ancylostoma duodenale]